LTAAEPFGFLVFNCHVPNLEGFGCLVGRVANEARIKTPFGVVFARLSKGALSERVVLRVEDEHDSITLLGIDRFWCKLLTILAHADWEHICGDCADQSSCGSENGEAHAERLKEGGDWEEGRKG